MTVYRIIDEWTYEKFELSQAAETMGAFSELVRTWNAKRDGEMLPSWSSFEAADFGPYLGFVSIWDIGRGPMNATARLWGTNLVELFGFEMTGKSLTHENLSPEQIDVEMQNAVVNDKKLTRCTGPMNWRDRQFKFLSYISLPCSSDGERVDVVIKCYLNLKTLTGT
jgi:hypothetical protein